MVRSSSSGGGKWQGGSKERERSRDKNEIKTNEDIAVDGLEGAAPKKKRTHCTSNTTGSERGVEFSIDNLFDRNAVEQRSSHN